MIELDKPSKCGLDARIYVFGGFGGYFYNDSLEEGMRCYHAVRPRIAEISPDIDIVLKRFCTEFEMRHGPSDKFEQSEDDKHWEKLVEENFALPSVVEVEQSEIIKNRAMKLWLEWANTYGDKTAWKYNKGKPLHRPSVTYHDRTD